jgi:pimeloyl-ACP methyl ester carboxylesterase
VNGVTLHYVIAGNGDPVLLLHGWPETWYAWRKIIPMLAARFTVVAPDMRGYGDSGRPSGGSHRFRDIGVSECSSCARRRCIYVTWRESFPWRMNLLALTGYY